MSTSVEKLIAGCTTVKITHDDDARQDASFLVESLLGPRIIVCRGATAEEAAGLVLVEIISDIHRKLDEARKLLLLFEPGA